MYETINMADATIVFSALQSSLRIHKDSVVCQVKKYKFEILIITICFLKGDDVFGARPLCLTGLTRYYKIKLLKYEKLLGISQ